MKKMKLFAPGVAVMAAAGLFLGGSVSQATAEDKPRSEPMWIGELPVFLTSEEAVSMWYEKMGEEQQRFGGQFTFPTDPPQILLISEDDEGNDYVYEQGLVVSLVSRASRCTKVASWVDDPEISWDEVEDLARKDFENFSKIPEIQQLSDIDNYRDVVKEAAEMEGVTEAEAELLTVCSDIAVPRRAV